MPVGRYRIKLAGRADPRLVAFLENLIPLLQAMPDGWEADLMLEREDPPGGVESAPTT